MLREQSCGALHLHFSHVSTLCVEETVKLFLHHHHHHHLLLLLHCSIRAWSTGNQSWPTVTFTSSRAGMSGKANLRRQDPTIEWWVSPPLLFHSFNCFYFLISRLALIRVYILFSSMFVSVGMAIQVQALAFLFFFSASSSNFSSFLMFSVTKQSSWE